MTLRVAAGALLTVSLSSCSCRIHSHDPDAAAQSAIEFARDAFVRNDAERAWARLSDDMKRTTSVQMLREALANMHPRTRPTSVTAEEFEKIPGQPAMNVFLEGGNQTETFFYRLLMEGSAKDGYKVGGLFRGAGAYPSSKTQPIPSKQAT